MSQKGELVMDKVGDLLIRIKNGYMASLKEVVVKNSNLSVAILSLLKEEGYITSFKPDGYEVKVVLRYQDKKPVLTDVKRISKPGRRIYKGKFEIPRVLDGMGLAIISTPQGILSDKQARKKGVGGEVMAFVW